MKKNKDPNKVSNFKNTKIEYEYYSSFCMKTKPNNRYYNGELKRLTQEMRDTFCTEEGVFIQRNIRVDIRRKNTNITKNRDGT